MATEAPNHSQQNGTTNVNADLIVGVVFYTSPIHIFPGTYLTEGLMRLRHATLVGRINCAFIEQDRKKESPVLRVKTHASHVLDLFLKTPSPDLRLTSLMQDDGSVKTPLGPVPILPYMTEVDQEMAIH
ncbi:hypothetical protein F5Y02DRAFT_423123 [Annulohypoxylon stygium]|nr:hypothetical protein F5Y02DRAFT_423123 [Annulohypoxylon stygium]